MADLAGLSFAVSWDGANKYAAVTGGPFKGLSNVLSTFLYGKLARHLCTRVTPAAAGHDSHAWPWRLGVPCL